MAETSNAAARLTKFYSAVSPTLDSITSSLAAAGVDLAHVRARDLFERDLDCHNLGMHRMLDILADVASEYGEPTSGDTVLDVGCGLGGPGRFLVDRFGCSVLGIDIVPVRVELARALTELTRLTDRISYRVADATDLGLDDGGFAHVWMLDVSIHVRDKKALFAQVARVLQPDGLLVLHDQMGPLPRAMLPLRRQAPWIAPSLPQLIRVVEGAGMRLLTWRDTTAQVLDFFVGMRASLTGSFELVSEALDPEQRGHAGSVLDGYIETLSDLGGRTGVLVARRIAAT